MQYRFIDDYREIYDASQLRSLFAFDTFRIQGDSIATSSPVGAMIHAGINVTTEGAPVQTCTLKMLGVDPVKYSNWVGENFAKDFKKVLAACAKVRPVP